MPHLTQPKFVSAEEALKFVKSNDRIYIHTAAAAPQVLVHALTNRADELRNVEIVHLHTEGAAPYVHPDFRKSFHVNALFVASNMREAVNSGIADFIPNFLSEVPGFFRKGVLPLDVALIQVSMPDSHGFCSLGVSVEATKSAVDTAKCVIAQVNPNMPRVLGDGIFHVSKFDALVYSEDELPQKKLENPTDTEAAIGFHVASLIDDGATLQLGIGAIPNAVLAALKDHKNLGIHSEMFSDGVVELFERGVITGAMKKKRPGKIIGGFVIGTQKLYDFVNNNPIVELLDIAYVNDTSVIRQNPKVAAINSAIEVDITGQVCADSIGTKIFSGVGGQMDFIRGASLSEGGKPIIALPSQTSRGESRIVPFLKQGAGVVTTRAHVHYIITEFGVAYLYGKNLRERAQALINIAH
ncbi:MAG: acetyl-CoA hydrolase/transferase family protein, partial [Bacteroidia bacterium]